MKLTIKQKVAVGYALGLLILIVVSIASCWFITDFQVSAELRKQPYEKESIHNA